MRYFLLDRTSALKEGKKLAGEVVNSGSTNEITIETLVETVVDVTGAQVETRYEPLLYDTDPTRRRPDMTRATELLDWEPEIGLEQGLKATAAYFRKVIDA